MPDNLVKVSQADLGAAEAMLLDLCAPMTPLVANYAAVHFARHAEAARLAEQERCAKVAEIYGTPGGHNRDAGKAIAKAIRGQP